ncbi:IclR family transcriptional regulator [Alloyangia pacifica]|uniref:Transcriptional regulator, IclR family n=1 Tax=Alloyangia pacifica TaxID=311180 RepID=A0A1I6VHQ1_9RHOB|nr:IclR family transcriptional regulator [Alloyangia pacifica]SDH98433.1 transcriptional regulator, IclR family [Alloyangia pacifica]SFT13177.1 transcriptional regulator, IclR family [Alloyangia pacifica]
MTEIQIERKTKSVEAVIRALQVLKLFDKSTQELSLAEISRRTGMVKSTALRMLVSLAEEQMVTVTADRKYALGPEIYRLGKAYTSGFNLESHVRPAMQQLVLDANECVSFFQRIGNRRMCLFREDSDHLLREHVAEGDTVSLDRGAAGRVLTTFPKQDPNLTAPLRTLEQLPLVSIGERDAEINGLAAPVFSAAQGLVGALTISGPKSRLTESYIEELKPKVLRTAANLSARLGARFYG